MPMRYDGLIKLKTKIDTKTGMTRQASDVPHFQMFVCRKVAESGDGHTLFASSALFAKYLPSPWTMEHLSNLTWSCETSGFFASKLSGLPLVIKHPSTGAMCLRWHDNWDSAETQYAGTISRIENGPPELVEVLERLIYDQRVCVRMQWKEGDVVVSDNVAMLHSRTGFKNGDERELWRVHVN
ncbi:hypothetical protein AC578_9720 [Pseudocercospora eumusae]|uniref:TauD/TfdA-like domain-containing protein n=1 Tax=Pseudocercospora eumusae TaxID=321146 RepID=A0A139HQY7_9PEZI|nr:hypothetical protein AC578_9720 [Pseudocercospora eumusae]